MKPDSQNQMTLWSNEVKVQPELLPALDQKITRDDDGVIKALSAKLIKKSGKGLSLANQQPDLSKEELDREYLKLADLLKQAIASESARTSSNDEWTGLSLKRTKSRVTFTLATKASLVKSRKTITVQEALASLIKRGFSPADIAEMAGEALQEQAEALEVESVTNGEEAKAKEIEQLQAIFDACDPQPVTVPIDSVGAQVPPVETPAELTEEEAAYAKDDPEADQPVETPDEKAERELALEERERLLREEEQAS